MGKQNRRADSPGFEIRHRRPAGFERKPSESPCRKRSYGRRPSLRATLRSSYITLMSIDITLM